MNEYQCRFVIDIRFEDGSRESWARTVTLPFVPIAGMTLIAVNAYDTYDVRSVAWCHDKGLFLLTEAYDWTFRRGDDLAKAFGPGWAPYDEEG
jgi:hypothetical protein